MWYWITSALAATVFAITGQGGVVGAPYSTTQPSISVDVPATSGSVPTR